MPEEEPNWNDIKRGDLWNKPKTPIMLKFEKETNKTCLTKGNKIKGDFTAWLSKKGLKTKDFKPKATSESVRLKLEELASNMIRIEETLDFKISGRGWCYILEGEGFVDKSQFDKIQDDINKCRKNGLLPIDFTIEDETREFYNIESLQINYIDPKIFILGQINPIKKLYQNKNDVSFWKFQDCYIQVIVEKADIVALFYKTCKKYHIPIANAKGRSDINQRNLMALRFKKAEELGKQPVLLYYADHDPAGIKIVDDMMNNLRQIEKATKWNPENLIVDHFGLNKDFIDTKGLTWIDNLITGGKRDLGKLYDKYKAGTLSKKEKMYPYEIKYIEEFGVHKCEVNAVLPFGDIANKHLLDIITSEEYLGKNCFDEYNKELEKNKKEVKDILKKVKFTKRISRILRDVFELEDD